MSDKTIVKNLLKIEVARNEKNNVVGLRLSSGGDTCLIFNALNFQGLRAGNEFIPRIGEEITYMEVEL